MIIYRKTAREGERKGRSKRRKRGRGKEGRDRQANLLPGYRQSESVGL